MVVLQVSAPVPRDLRKGDLLLPFLFVTDMEALSCMDARTIDGDMLSRCRILGHTEGMLMNITSRD